MTDAPLSRPLFEITGFRFRLWPILLAAILMEGTLRLGREAARWVYRNGPAVWDGHPALFLNFAILAQAMIALGLILAMRRLLPQADAHLCWPPGRSLVGLALVIGLIMGLVMLVADYGPALASRTAPDGGYPLAPLDAAGFLVGMLITGLAEETLFRGVLVGMLVVLTPGRIRLGSFEIPVAGVIVAVLFGLAHWKSFVVGPLYLALAQQGYAFAWGLIYVWLMERSRSLLAPVVAHGVGNFVEVGAVMLLMRLWS